MRIYRLDNPSQRYAWGSASGITEALGIPNPGGGPLAEIWMGAHPSAPSTVQIEGGRIGLDDLISRDPDAYLGETVVDRFGESLPFLFKVLSAGKPLSIQAHPSKRKARIGFDRENLAGTPIDAPERNYRDPNYKPEMAVALTRFELICGFRPVAEIIENMRIAVPGEFERALERLERDPGRVELSVFFYGLISLDERERVRILADAAEHIRSALESGAVPQGRETTFRWCLRIGELFPSDIGALLPLILNHVVLEPGRAVFIAPGELHAHLSGTCLEIMANSDNVIRGALTPKFVDIPELISVLSFNPEPLLPVEASPVAPCEDAYPVYVPDFQISRIAVGPSAVYRRSTRGPEILLCGSSSVEVSCIHGKISLGRGESAFVAADACDYEISSTREALVFRASVPDIP
jgi:mannose-6-phosphate isomerase